MILIADDYAAIRALLARLEEAKCAALASARSASGEVHLASVKEDQKDLPAISEIYRAYRCGSAP